MLGGLHLLFPEEGEGGDGPADEGNKRQNLMTTSENTTAINKSMPILFSFRHPPDASVNALLDRVREQVSASLSTCAPVPLTGASGVGKSYMLNMLIAAFDKGYAAKIRQDDYNALRSNKPRLALINRSKLRDLQPSSNSGIILIHPNNCDYPTEMERLMEIELLERLPQIRKGTAEWNEFLKSRDNTIPGYALVSSSENSAYSTTTHPVNVRYSAAWHASVEYESIAEIEQKLRSYPFAGMEILHSQNKLEEDDAERHKYMLEYLTAVCDVDMVSYEDLDPSEYYSPSSKDIFGEDIVLPHDWEFKTRLFPKSGRRIRYRQNILNCAGKTLVFIGKGEDDFEDRLYIRRTLNGILRDGYESEFRPPQGTASRVTSLDNEGSNNGVMKAAYHSATRSAESVLANGSDKFVIKSVDLYAPCALFELGLVLQDSPGNMDSNPLRSHNMRESLRKCRSIMVFKSRAADIATNDALRKNLLSRWTWDPSLFRTNGKCLVIENNIWQPSSAQELGGEFQSGKIQKDLEVLQQIHGSRTKSLLFATPQTTTALVYPSAYMRMLMNTNSRTADADMYRSTSFAIAESGGRRILTCLLNNSLTSKLADRLNYQLNFGTDVSFAHGVLSVTPKLWTQPDLTEFIKQLDEFAGRCSSENKQIDAAMALIFYERQGVHMEISRLLQHIPTQTILKEFYNYITAYLKSVIQSSTSVEDLLKYRLGLDWTDQLHTSLYRVCEASVRNAETALKACLDVYRDQVQIKSALSRKDLVGAMCNSIREGFESFKKNLYMERSIKQFLDERYEQCIHEIGRGGSIRQSLGSPCITLDAIYLETWIKIKYILKTVPNHLCKPVSVALTPQQCQNAMDIVSGLAYHIIQANGIVRVGDVRWLVSIWVKLCEAVHPDLHSDTPHGYFLLNGVSPERDKLGKVPVVANSSSKRVGRKTFLERFGHRIEEFISDMMIPDTVRFTSALQSLKYLEPLMAGASEMLRATIVIVPLNKSFAPVFFTSENSIIVG